MKQISFKYFGGTQTVMVTPGQWSIALSDGCEWLAFNEAPTALMLFAKENVSYEDRYCKITLYESNGGIDYIEVEQEGFRDLSIAIPEYILIPETAYDRNAKYDVPFRVYGGSCKYSTDRYLMMNIDKVYDGNGFYSDYMMHIGKGMDGTYIFRHADEDAYTEYILNKGFETYSKDTTKQITIKTIDKNTMNGFTIFAYNSEDYINKLPENIVVNEETVTEIDLKECVFMDKNMEEIKPSNFETNVTSNWLMAKYDPQNKKFYLKARSENKLSDRKCVLLVRCKDNHHMLYTTTIIQPSKVQ